MLSWELAATPEAGAAYELQQADNPDFLNASRIAISAAGDMTLSGFRDGDYYFRAGDGNSWTQTVTVTVDHPPLAQALIFFLLGLTLFITLTICITIGNKQHRLHIDNGSHHE